MPKPAVAGSRIPKRAPRAVLSPDERAARVQYLRRLIQAGRYDLEGKFEAIFDDFVHDALGR